MSLTVADYQPILARTRTVHRPVGPIAYDCVKVVVVRSGSAILFSEFGQKPANVGDVVMLGANVLCGSEPEGHITVTTIYLDTDYVLDQLFWQYAGILRDRIDVHGLAQTLYSEPAQVLRLGEDRTGLLMPWLDELVTLSVEGGFREHFHRMQSLWFAVADVVTPFVRVSPIRLTTTQRARTRPTLPRDRRFAPMREEARQTGDALRGDLAANWTLGMLARMVHLSPKQLSRVFTDAYGKTPQAYLTMLRVEQMARLLRETDLTIAEAGQRVGWSSRNRASAAFHDCTGLTPSHYRTMQARGSACPASRQPVLTG
ncbi:helix-turn-helix transcriptional regulator [Propionibacteriaceae bacterium Y1685]